MCPELIYPASFQGVVVFTLLMRETLILKETKQNQKKKGAKGRKTTCRSTRLREQPSRDRQVLVDLHKLGKLSPRGTHFCCIHYTKELGCCCKLSDHYSSKSILDKRTTFIYCLYRYTTVFVEISVCLLCFRSIAEEKRKVSCL